MLTNLGELYRLTKDLDSAAEPLGAAAEAICSNLEETACADARTLLTDLDTPEQVTRAIDGLRGFAPTP